MEAAEMIFKDWRFFILLYIVCSGVWSVLAKFASIRLGVLTTTFVAVTSAAVVVTMATFRELQFQSASGVAAAAIGGVLGGFASLALYSALRQAPVSVVMPLSSLYLILTVPLSYLFLGESIGVRQLLGIAFGLLAIALIAR